MSAYMFLNTIFPAAIAGIARMAKLGYSLPVQSVSNVVFLAELVEHCVSMGHTLRREHFPIDFAVLRDGQHSMPDRKSVRPC